jgi:signal transduction histidine kinase/CheY-like chemotaxis protein/ABC-type amino acid transport substrate-binding protein
MPFAAAGGETSAGKGDIMYRNRGLRLFAVWSLVVLLLGLCAPAAEATTAGAPVRIGMIQQQGYADEGTDGQLSGINVEYAYKIGQYANFPVQIVLYKSGKEALEELDAGKIDIMSNIIKSPDREKKYLFASRELGSLPMCVFTSKTSRQYTYRNIQQLRNMTFGAESVSKVKDLFSVWCSNHGFQPHIRIYETLDGIEKALASGEVDAGLYGAPSLAGYRTIQTFSPVPYYLIFPKGSTVLKDRVDRAMETILTEDPLYFDKLVRKYTSSIQYEMEALTSKERAYFRKHQTLTVAVLKNDQPYYSLDANGKSKGILPDFYKRISSLLGTTFRFRAYDCQSDAITAVASGKVDILGLYSNGQVAANELNLRLTRAYANVDTVLLMRSGTSTSKIRSIALKFRSKNSIQTGTEKFFHAKYVVFNNATECFQSLRQRKTDAMLCGLPSATWLINQNLVSAYTIQTITSGSLELCSATEYSNSTLCSALNKAINVSERGFNEIMTNDTLPEDSLETSISRIPPLRTAIAVCALMALVLGLVLALIALQRRHKERAALMEKAAENQRKENELEAMARATESKNQFFSNISHDMRTPLNAIIGFSRLAQDKDVPPDVRSDLEKIQSSGNLLLDLINDTLTISKANSGKLGLHAEAAFGREIFDSVIIPIQESAQQKGITFTTDTSRVTQRYVLADKLNLQKIMLNLLTNAVKYTPAGGQVDFIVRDEPSGAGAPVTVITVRDNGIGMSEDFLEHLYEPFVQEERSGYESKGTGLGLSIVKQLVELMGGTIDVRSRLNAGTEFTVRLQLETAPNEEKEDSRQTDTIGKEELRGKKILLCEDNQLNREIAGAFLDSVGIITVYAENGSIGVQLFSDSAPEEFSAILMDIRMPVMDGYEATRQIRKLDRPDAQTVPILAMTADALEEDIQRGLSAGMNGYLTKPVEPQKLLDLLEKTIHRGNDG